MNKKISLSLLSSFAVLASPTLSHAMGTIQDGFFAGLGGAAVLPNYGYEVTAADEVSKTSNTVLLRPDIDVGYGELFSANNLYIGVDLGAQLGTSKSSEVAYLTDTVATTSASQGNVYYFDIMPGFVLGDQSSVFYGIIGAADGSFKLEQTGDYAFSSTESHFAYRLGMGYTLALTNNFSVDAKYVFSDFDSIDFENGLSKYTLNPKNNAVSLGVNYTFGAAEPNSTSPFVVD